MANNRLQEVFRDWLRSFPCVSLIHSLLEIYINQLRKAECKSGWVCSPTVVFKEIAGKDILAMLFNAVPKSEFSNYDMSYLSASYSVEAAQNIYTALLRGLF